MVDNFDQLLSESARVHGHLCPGQVLGVRMSLLGLREVEIEDPKGEDRKHLVVFVEMDRCATDAIQSVTGCSLGHRTMKFLDYGKMAATFVNVKTGKSVRIVAREDSRRVAKEFSRAGDSSHAAQVEAYRVMPDSLLFSVMNVRVHLRDEDLPGKPLARVMCDMCGEYVQDMREVSYDGRVICKACAYGGYYEPYEDIGSASAMQYCHNGLQVRSKLWLEIDGEPLFGRGRKFLLEAIGRYGSISEAARQIGVSYRRAWSYIRAMEDRLGIPLVERRAGGRHGGQAVLTEHAREFLEQYDLLEAGMRDLVDLRFTRIFGRRRKSSRR